MQVNIQIICWVNKRVMFHPATATLHIYMETNLRKVLTIKEKVPTRALKPPIMIFASATQ